MFTFYDIFFYFIYNIKNLKKSKFKVKYKSERNKNIKNLIKKIQD
jgi:hypothetical protein